MTFLQIASWLSYGSMVQCQKIYILCVRFNKMYLFCHGIHHFNGSSMQRCWSDSVSEDVYFVFISTKYISVVTEHIISIAVQCSDCWFNTVADCMLLVLIKRLWFGVGRFIFCVSFWPNISLLSQINLRRCIAATLNWRSYKLYVSWMPYKNMIQCQKIYILCFVSTKYISVDTEYIVSMSLQHCSHCTLCWLYSLNGYDSVSEDLYFVFRFDKIYLYRQWIHHFSVFHMQLRRPTILLMIDFLELL